jgi:hypothetical protein
MREPGASHVDVPLHRRISSSAFAAALIVALGVGFVAGRWGTRAFGSPAPRGGSASGARPPGRIPGANIFVVNRDGAPSVRFDPRASNGAPRETAPESGPWKALQPSGHRAVWIVNR